MAPSRRPPRPVRRQYARVAGRYDRRWEAYTETSLGPALEALRPGPGARLLDVGCGTGVLLARAHERWPSARLVGVDLAPEMLAVARARLPAGAALAAASAADLPFPALAFDVLVSTSSLHHWPDPAAALREAARVLAPGGRIVITDWSADTLRARLRVRLLRLVDRSIAHVHTGDGLRGLLADAGFRVESHRRFRAAGGWEMMSVAATKADG